MSKKEFAILKILATYAAMTSNLLANRCRASFFATAGDKPAGSKWFKIKNLATDEKAEITIYDQIGRDWWSGEGIAGKDFVEELKSIPMSREILLRINCPGGNVHDGMLIYNRMAERRDKVVVKVDGVAASIGSVIALCGRSLEMPSNSLLMIHDPWAMVQGNAEDLRQAAKILDTHRDAIANVYVAKTGMTMEECQKQMAAETWFTGEEAVDAGFADKVTEEIDFQACFDLSRFKHVPAQITKPQAAAGKETVNRKKLMARLKKLGITFDEKATEAELKALLAAHDGDAGPQNSNQGQNESHEEDANEGEEEEQDEEEEAVEGEASSPAASSDVANRSRRRAPRDPAFARMQADLARVTAHYTQERRNRITAAVNRCVDEDRIPASQAETWTTRALADEAILNDLQSMPPRPPGAPAVVAITSENPVDIARGVMAYRDPLKSWLRGNSVDGKILSQNAMAMATEITKYRKQLTHVLNVATNSVDADLKRNVILNDIMRAFKRRIVSLNVFSTVFTNVPLEGTNKIVIPYFELDTTHSKHFNPARGYEFTENTDAVTRDFTIDHRQYKAIEFSSETFRRQPYFNPQMSLMLKAEQLALDVWYDVLSLVRASNFPLYAAGGAASSFDVDDVASISGVADKNDWPEIGRALVLDTNRKVSLLQDDSLKHYLNSGSTEPLRSGSTGRLFDFDMYYSPRIKPPGHPEDIGGFAVLPPAILVGTAPIAPAPGVRSLLLSYDLVVDPDLGVALEYKYWGEPEKDKDREVVECNYGYKKGNSSALIRVNDTDQGTLETSSSSSSGHSSSSSSSGA